MPARNEEHTLESAMRSKLGNTFCEAAPRIRHLALSRFQQQTSSTNTFLRPLVAAAKACIAFDHLDEINGENPKMLARNRSTWSEFVDERDDLDPFGPDFVSRFADYAWAPEFLSHQGAGYVDTIVYRVIDGHQKDEQLAEKRNILSRLLSAGRARRNLHGRGFHIANVLASFCVPGRSCSTGWKRSPN